MADRPVDQPGATPALEAIVDPSTYERGYPHDAWAWLRAERPVCRVEPAGYAPFWAVTRYADVAAISRDPKRFGSAGRWLILPEAIDLDGSRTGQVPLRMLVNMDPPEHRAYRRVAGTWFTPRNIDALGVRVRAAADGLVGGLTARSDEVDLVQDLAAQLPLLVIMDMLGVPREDAELVLRLSNENFGAADPDFRRLDGARDGFLQELGDYLVGLGYAKRAAPGDDLASVIAAATIDDSPIPDLELMSYLYLLATAGHETTRNAISGGLMALAERPDDLARLRHEPALLSRATEEVLRWTSPIVHFARTAREDCVLHGARIRAGDSVALFYPSANRDETVFASPEDFRIDRDPNPQIAFGHGEHYCLGAALARLEVRAVLEAVASHASRIEPTGEARRLRSNFVGGLKTFPARLVGRH